MKILDIDVINFRNIKKKSVQFADCITYVYGKNASGKTNLMEAVYYLSYGKSFRNVRDSEIKMRGSEYFYVNGNIISNGIEHSLKVGVKEGEKRIIVDGRDVKKVSDLFGIFVSVIFTPDDVNIINGTPRIRRRFIDRMIASTDRDYIRCLKKYNYALEQRNRLLKDDFGKDDRLFRVYENVLVENGLEIARRRNDMIEKLNGIVPEAYKKITGTEDRISIEYKSGFFMLDKNDLSVRFESERNNDRLVKRTVFGVHTDDVRIFLNGENARYFASTGERKSIVTALKIAESNVYYSVKKEYPVMLLDDVFSELDEIRRKNLLDYFVGKTQVIITSPERYKIGENTKYLSMEHE